MRSRGPDAPVAPGPRVVRRVSSARYVRAAGRRITVFEVT